MDDQYDPGSLTSPRASQQDGPPWGPGSGAPGRGQAGDGPARGSRGSGRHSLRSPGDSSRRGAAAAPPDDGDETAPAGRKRKNFWRELLVIVVAAAVLTVLVKAFVVQVYRIPSASMENTLMVNDRVLVNKLVYHFRGIARGDIVVFSGQDSWGPDAPPPPGDPVVRIWDDIMSDIGLQSSQTYYIKRVIGLPGDRVACCTDGNVTVNGVPLAETSYLYPGDSPSFPFKPVTVPPGHLWVMGDHRSDSDDSRYHLGDPGGGSIPETEVVGRAFLIIWPPSQIRDLPIPSTFGHAALHSGAIGAAGAGVIAAPLLLRRRRRDAKPRAPGLQAGKDG